VKKWLRKHLLPSVVYWFYRLLYSTWRTELHEPESLKSAIKNKEPLIFAHWHGHELAIVQLVVRYKLATMTSKSSDGQLIDYVIVRLGGATSKGSSSKGAVGALKGLIRLVRAGHPASMAVDGPRGPIYEVKPGVFELSRLAKAKIFPVGVACGNPWVFHKSWNKAVLPKPFSKVSVLFTEPISAISAKDDTKSPELAETLKAHISDACRQAGKSIDLKIP